MEISFLDKYVLVGGCTSGIGLSTAEVFAEHGANLVLLGRDENMLENLVVKLNKNANQKHYYLVVDYKNPVDLELKVKDLIEKENLKISVLVNNVGGPMPANILDLDKEDYTEQFNKQFLSFHVLTKTVMNGLIESEDARIINILGTSVKSTIANLGLSVFKSSVLSWSKTLSEELGQFNITVNNILPGPTNTKEFERIIQYFADHDKGNEINVESVKNGIPLKRIAEPLEIANIALFLASKYASFVNGSNVTVDGGYSKTLY